MWRYPSGAVHDCTGALYQEGDYATNRPLRNVKVYVQDADTFAVIGSGITDNSGAYNITWASYRRWPVRLRVVTSLEHKDGRFTVLSKTGQKYMMLTPNVLRGNATAINFGSHVFGRPTAPNKIANLYAGAEFMWASLNESARMRSRFNNLQILAFFAQDEIGPNRTQDCNSSCFVNGFNQLHINENDAFRPQARIWHEMGHAASYEANHRWQHAGYDYVPSNGWAGAIGKWVGGVFVLEGFKYPPYPTGDWGTAGCQRSDVWCLETPEWLNAGFEEAMATFLASRAIYRQNAPAPLLCLSEFGCNDVGRNQIELSKGAACVDEEGRMPMSSIRYLWDVYDAHVDGEDNTLTSFTNVINTLTSFEDGTGNHQDRESGNDGVNASDFAVVMSSSIGYSSGHLLEMNCRPYVQ